MSDIVKFKKGAVIFSEGETEETMYSIVSGKVAIYANYNTPAEKLLTELDANKFFGEMGLIESQPRSATAVAVADTNCEVITNKNLESFLHEHPERMLEIMQATSARLRELSKDYVTACKAVSQYAKETENGEEHSKELIDCLKKYSGIAKKHKRK